MKRFGPGTFLAAIEFALMALFLLAPLWALLDFGFDFNVKVPIFEDNLPLRIGYYVAMVALGVAMWRYPRLAPPLGVVDSGIQVALIAMAVFGPYANLAEAAMTGEELETITVPWGAMVLNAMILSLGLAGSWGEVMHAGRGSDLEHEMTR